MLFNVFLKKKSIKRKSGGGRKEGFKDIKLFRKLVKNFKNNPSLSLKERAKIYVFSQALIWQAICSCGKKSASYISQSTLSGQIYVKECLQKRLLPLIKSHNNRPVFSSDLASIHYCKLAMEWYKKNNVKFVPKTENLPKWPEL